MITSKCTEHCERAPECTVCRRRKKPIGRDSMDNGLCDDDCKGYRQPPSPGHLWPGELARESEAEPRLPMLVTPPCPHCGTEHRFGDIDPNRINVQLASRAYQCNGCGRIYDSTPKPERTKPRPVAQVTAAGGVASIRGVSGMCPRGHIGGTAERCESCETVADAVRSGPAGGPEEGSSR